ncbi:hypothetical protein PV08_09989 [Exophiala spinifera]|uniref:Carrier domain-containing protein n=1 Tax=Exophiala spinifera TaxID=91928 RepID=A0A0D1YCP7_9EURO|nr:uncharacterized protein PV08_09989 [Exophiala spinifera]KIW12711.1 hypothetical protein PV08_09989 [Exophiala spinifera]
MATSQSTQTQAQQLLPIILDRRARDTPDNVFAKVPRSPTSYRDGFRAVKYSELVNAINQVAWLIEQGFGKGNGFPTITYLGPSDLRYSIVVVAAIKAGYKTFLPSPRNSISAHISLLSRLECSRLVVTNPELPCVAQIESEITVQKFAIPSLADLLDLELVPNYPYFKSFDIAKSDPIFILHTSGSTGIPKPLTYTNSFVSGIAANTSLAPPYGYQMLDRHFRTGSFFMTLPAFHVAGIGFSLIVPSFQSSVPVYPLPTAPPTTEGLLEAAGKTEVDWAFVPPVVIEQLARDPALLDEAASKLKYLFYTGGSVSQASGDVVIQKLDIYQCLGSSECATFPLIRPSSDETCTEWRYIQIHPAVKHEFRHRFEDLHELVVIKNADHELNQPVFGHFPGTTEYATRDLFLSHPTKPGLWTHKSRIDDVIVFLNGEKTNPISFEQAVSAHPEVKSALVGGAQRFEAFLLIELVNPKNMNTDERHELLDRLWPIIADANFTAPAHARISKTKVIFSRPDKPFPRAGKGTVQRRATMDLYQEQIDEAYAEPERDGTLSPPVGVDFTKPETLKALVESLVKQITNWTDISSSDEFFGRGMDSLQVLKLTRELKTTFGLSNLAIRNIYANPTIELLTQAISKVAVGETEGSSPEDTDGKVLEATVEAYSRHLDRMSASIACQGDATDERDSKGRVVVLTGSTGTLGSYLLHQFVGDTEVSHIVCLNRSTDSRSVQQTRNASHQLDTDISEDRVSFFTADLSKPSFGLTKSEYDHISTTATEIVHCSWPVDFNKSLPSFHSSLDGIVNLAVFAATARKSPSLLFISSISAVSSYSGGPRAAIREVPETIVKDITAPAPMGYGQSKYLAERILDMASHKFRIKTGVVRVGQICGTSYNLPGWSRNEWFPSLVLSSQYIGALPDSLGSKSAEYPDGVMGTIDWIPVDKLPGIIVELLKSLSYASSKAGARVFHAVNPRTTGWRNLSNAVRRALMQRTNSPDLNETSIVTFGEWLSRLQYSSKAGQAKGYDQAKLAQENPAIKLLGFFESLAIPAPQSEADAAPGGRGLARLALTSTLQASPTLANLESIKAEWMYGWVDQWK